MFVSFLVCIDLITLKIFVLMANLALTITACMAWSEGGCCAEQGYDPTKGGGRISFYF